LRTPGSQYDRAPIGREAQLVGGGLRHSRRWLAHTSRSGASRRLGVRRGLIFRFDRDLAPIGREISTCCALYRNVRPMRPTISSKETAPPQILLWISIRRPRWRDIQNVVPAPTWAPHIHPLGTELKSNPPATKGNAPLFVGEKR